MAYHENMTALLTGHQRPPATHTRTAIEDEHVLELFISQQRPNPALVRCLFRLGAVAAIGTQAGRESLASVSSIRHYMTYLWQPLVRRPRSEEAAHAHHDRREKVRPLCEQRE